METWCVSYPHTATLLVHGNFMTTVTFIVILHIGMLCILSHHLTSPLPTTKTLINTSYYGLKGNSLASNAKDSFTHYLLGSKLPTAVPIWQSSIRASDIEYMRDHLTLAGTVYPAAAYADILPLSPSRFPLLPPSSPSE